MARLDAQYRTKRLREFVEVVEVYDVRGGKWDETFPARQDVDSALSRCCAGTCVL